MIKLETPLTIEKVESLRVGDQVLLSGTIYTGRDAAHKRFVEAIKNNEGVLLITADHGNAEQMLDYKTGEPHTAHTTNPVPFILVGKEDVKLKEGKLADIAPTMLDLMGLEKPEEMTGESIIEK